MAMLHGWIEYGLQSPVVAHFDHRLREASKDDAEFVGTVAAKLGLPFELGVWTNKPEGEVGEKQARDARYRFLIGVADKYRAASIAVGHTRDDQAETILFRILRGTGVDGLAGMLRYRYLSCEGPWLVRPLLETTRKAARDFLTERGLKWREDATNTDPRRTRNRIRAVLFPLLAAEFNLRIVDALVGLGQVASEYSSIVGRRCEALWNEARCEVAGNEWIVPIASLERIPKVELTAFLRYVFLLMSWPMGRMDVRAWGRLTRVASPGGPPRWQGPDGMTAERTATSFIVRRRSP
jgi:tRNA(Ile)-lysidine synthase